ncbi:ATP-binding response regulator [Quisquiliibacterium transsilvanicum]|uniref:histidine kinase n=1 Tax=Quisquiliibacterium transsilvanicum TaxID=1549638 RepID=A0A7W8M743_9BURK|nr:ATP-binding protein [Quisquiliibacterium transsilvanicum]MBB5270192.1 anti-sigma regulatory factor (Ser/Thr protein kinase) [Quisquiliibacterium transsilvanicum]
MRRARKCAARATGCSSALHEPDLPEFLGPNRTAVGDPNRIAQILRNLVDNAIKFTGSGGVTVRARILIDPAHPDSLCVDVWVADTGPGIPAHLQSMVFAAFTQADEATTRRFGGTGLGLAISQELCHAMNGDIRVSSVPGAGATFSFRVRCGSGARLLPAPALAPATDASDATGTPGDEALPSRRVLVAEDNAVNRKVLQLMLSSAGMEVEFAVDGEQACCLAAGMNGHVAKPIQRKELLETIRRHLAQGAASTQPPNSG